MLKIITILVLFIIVSGIGVPLKGLAMHNPWAISRDEVGLNMHWALGGFAADQSYIRTIQKSKTTWVREHFYTEVLIRESDPSAWFDRYDWVMEQYKQQGVNVVGMLAYGPTHGDFQKPKPEDWELFIRKIVKRYKRYVRVWEVWNEPDSPTYLTPNNPETFQPIMEQAYAIIKEIQPRAIVLNGGLAFPNPSFASQMFEQYGNSFDAFAFHVYTCRDGNLDSLKKQLADVKVVMDQYGRSEKAWVTEFGCSTGSPGISEDWQKEYLRQAAETMIETGWIERVFVYTIRDRDIDDEYENQFGLWTTDFQPHPSWKWFRAVPLGPYQQKRKSAASQAKAADHLRAALSRYFPNGITEKISERFDLFVDAVQYGGYPKEAIVQTMRYGGGKAMHPLIPFDRWKKTEQYKKTMAKDFVNLKPIFAYNKSRLPLEVEKEKAKELKESLLKSFNQSFGNIDSSYWSKLVNAYVYGGYPVSAIGRAPMVGGRTVHERIPYAEWSKTKDYKDSVKAK